MNGLLAPSDPAGLRELLLLIVVAGGLWYCLRTALALVLIALSQRRPTLHGAALRCAPSLLRPLLGRALIGGLLSAGLASPAAWADAAGCAPDGGGVPVLDRADTCGSAARPALPHAPAATGSEPAASASAGAAQAPTGPHQAEIIAVTAGDSLWSISSRLLGATAATADIAAAWPLLWEENRSAIGADPDLIHPGTELHIPADFGRRAQP
jgi:hypothetical protein